MKRMVPLLGVAIISGAVWAAGCGVQKPAGGEIPVLSAQMKQAAVERATTALNDMVAKVNGGNAVGGRAAYQVVDAAFGELLAPVGFTDVNLARQLSNANESLRDLMSAGRPDRVKVAQQSQVTAGLLRQVGSGVTARASAQSGMLAQNERTFTIKAKEYQFEPALIEVKKGTKVRIRLQNTGRERHEFELDAFNFEIGPIKPGSSAEGTFVADRSGIYEYACHVNGHYEKGMRGFLVVKE